MSLNIKNERVHALAREAARVTGTSQTSAIETALERLLAEHGVDLARAERDRRIAEILDISRSWNPTLPAAMTCSRVTRTSMTPRPDCRHDRRRVGAGGHPQG